MNEPLTLLDLDTLRAGTMRALLNATGREEIWKYDVMPLRDAYREALDYCNFDNLQRDAAALQAGHRFALVGAGIEDHPFTTPAQLVDVLVWLCCEGYLSPYASSTKAPAVAQA